MTNGLHKAFLAAQKENDRFTEAKLLPILLKKKRNYNNKTFTNDVDRFLDKVAFTLSNCWYWIGCLDQLGYGHVGYKRAHRWSWELHNGEIPKGMNVLHKCDVRSCVNPDHLFLGTQKDNVLDMIKKGRHKCVPKYGEDNPMSVLTKKLAIKIRKDFSTGRYKQIELSKKYKVSPMTISRLLRGISWKI